MANKIFQHKPPSNSGRLISKGLSLQGNTAHSDRAEIPSINIYYTNENPCLLFFPSFRLSNKYTVNK